jgi:hypothetical protein
MTKLDFSFIRTGIMDMAMMGSKEQKAILLLDFPQNGLR